MRSAETEDALSGQEALQAFKEREALSSHVKLLPQEREEEFEG